MLFSIVRSYIRRASSDQCPVLSCISLSRTPLLYICSALAALKLSFVLLSSIPACLVMLLSLFWRVSFPTGTAAYQGTEGSVGASDNG